VREI
jgi:hypothetical protein